jgi:hypothetical protein
MSLSSGSFAFTTWPDSSRIRSSKLGESILVNYYSQLQGSHRVSLVILNTKVCAITRPSSRGSAMTGGERERLYELCGQILIEHDPAKLIKLVRELNDLLDIEP